MLALFMGGGDGGGSAGVAGSLAGSGPGSEVRIEDFRQEIGHVCAEMVAVRDRELRRERTFGKRVRVARTVDAQRAAIMDEVAKRLNASFHLLAQLEAQEPPTDELVATQREAVAAWGRNIKRLQTYRDDLKDVGTAEELASVVARMNQRRSATETDSRAIRSRVQRLGGPDCRLPLTRPPARIEIDKADANPARGNAPPAIATPAPAPQPSGGQTGGTGSSGGRG